MKIDYLKEHFPDALVAVNELLAGHGRDKHEEDEWRKLFPADNADLAVDHLERWMCEEAIDPDTGKSHLINAACRCIMALQKELEEK